MTFRVLVADDDEWTRSVLRSYLVAEGMEVDGAATGSQALECVRTGRPDIVFLDVELPESTGLEILACIRQQALDTAVVITTAYGSEEVVVDALRRGADDYLSKPFDRHDVQVVIDRTVARLLLTRQNAALRAQLLEHQRQLDEELARAAAVVRELLPAQAPAVAGFELAATCLSACELGGDFYDWQQLPGGRISLTVGDVMGKGLPAALLMATVRAVLRALVTDNGPAAVVQRAAAALDEDLARSGAFVTLFHAQIDTDSGEVRYVDAGHGYILVRRQNGLVEELKPWALPIGVDAAERYAEGRVLLAAGDTLVIYSDGLTEARPELFGDREAVAGFLERAGDADTAVRRMLEEVAAIRPLPDDLTLLVLRRQATGAAVSSV